MGTLFLNQEKLKCLWHPCVLQPAMKAREIADAGIEALKSRKYRLVRLNFANPDMVAHTGDLDAAIEACSIVDKCVKVCLYFCNVHTERGPRSGDLTPFGSL